MNNDVQKYKAILRELKRMEDDGDIKIIILPSGYMNVGIADNVLVADTNNSAKWGSFRIPLPDGEWEFAILDERIIVLYEKEKF